MIDLKVSDLSVDAIRETMIPICAKAPLIRPDEIQELLCLIESERDEVKREVWFASVKQLLPSSLRDLVVSSRGRACRAWRQGPFASPINGEGK